MGNLNYYIGARIAETGYVRDRDREFNESERRPKADVLASFDAAIAMVIRTIEKQSKQDWLRPYSAERDPAHTRFPRSALRCNNSNCPLCAGASGQRCFRAQTAGAKVVPRLADRPTGESARAPLHSSWQDLCQ